MWEFVTSNGGKGTGQEEYRIEGEVARGFSISWNVRIDCVWYENSAAMVVKSAS